jgi:molecular chaperone HtpG
MIEALTTQAEMRAQEAEDLPAFSGIKLLHIKRQVAELLSLIGRNGIFDEYTRHDISHIDEMLEILDWLLPEDTEAIMSPADWLLTVLAIYFHDLGMLVTRQEYEARNSSGFPEYRDNVLFAGDAGADYRAKVEQLPPDKVARFLYQEFVRHKHAERIRNWIMGRAPEHLGITHHAMSEVEALLNPLDPQFRRDLALVCESHHLTDLNDFQKYKVAQPYGNSDEETANLQFAAVLLRTTDLLHITRDRTPSVAFRMINPTDPLSQEEWAKQMAVKRVRSQLGRDREGNPDENAPRDTIEVHAYFTQENGFFGLTSYLLYAGEQIRKSYGWVQEANRLKAARHKFPWRFIDDRNIQTEGFLRETFEFAIDQPKILDLLTGHTLYNDTRIVLRELVQNSLDAIRLQNLIDRQTGSTAEPGSVKIHWDSQQRTLSVEDNGTGMTQDIIEHHLLKIGASRYQDEEFKRQHPDFSPISRFGIGILSAFMIADSVEITTCHPDDVQARQLSLRSVHGRYLIQLLDKQTDEVAKRLAPHGTLIRLKVRPAADMPEVIETAKRWVVMPGCEVTVTADDGSPVQVGFSSPREAVLDVLQELGISVDNGSKGAGGRRVRVDQKELDGVTLAYAVEWSEYFREWSFLQLPGSAFSSNREAMPLLGTCVEGVRVESGTPGFKGRHIVAIANAKGVNAPKTNVVRSGLEVTPERDAMLRAVYSIYCNHVMTEMRELHEKRQYSLTWATQESRYLGVVKK